MQIRAARALLGLGQDDLAKMAGVSVGTVKRLESPRDEMSTSIGTLLSIRRALEQAGVAFIDGDAERGPGVRLSRPREPAPLSEGRSARGVR